MNTNLLKSKTVNVPSDASLFLDNVRFTVGNLFAGMKNKTFHNPFQNWLDPVQSRLSPQCQLNILLFHLSSIVGDARIYYQSLYKKTELLNHYGVVFAPSGTGKDVTFRDFYDVFSKPYADITARKRKEYHAKYQQMSDALEKKKNKSVSIKDVKEALKLEGIFQQRGITSCGTPEGAKAARGACGAYADGSFDIFTSEMGFALQNDPSYNQFLSVVIESFNGLHYDKSIKMEDTPTSCSGVSVNYLGFSNFAPFQENKVLKNFKRILSGGLARRSFITVSDNYIPPAMTNEEIWLMVTSRHEIEIQVDNLKRQAEKFYDFIRNFKAKALSAKRTPSVTLSPEADIALTMFESQVKLHMPKEDMLSECFASLSDKVSRLASFLALTEERDVVSLDDIYKCIPVALAFYQAHVKAMSMLDLTSKPVQEKTEKEVLDVFSKIEDQSLAVQDFKKTFKLKRDMPSGAFEKTIQEMSDSLPLHTLSIEEVPNSRGQGAKKKVVVLRERLPLNYNPEVDYKSASAGLVSGMSDFMSSLHAIRTPEQACDFLSGLNALS